MTALPDRRLLSAREAAKYLGCSLPTLRGRIEAGGSGGVAAGGADTPYLIFLNPDAFPKPDWLADLIALASILFGLGALVLTVLWGVLGSMRSCLEALPRLHLNAPPQLVVESIMIQLWQQA